MSAETLGSYGWCKGHQGDILTIVICMQGCLEVNTMPRGYWLFKSEPSAYSFQDLLNENESTAEWDGVRNFQARNYLRDEVKVGDGVLFYHSNITPPSVVGVAVVVREGYPDNTAWDPNSDHPDPRSTADKPLWFMVDIQAEAYLPREVPLSDLRAMTELEKCSLFTRPRLSIHPISLNEWRKILEKGGQSE